MGPSDSFQTLTDLRAMLDSAGRRPNHRLGQNFLIDRNLMMKLVEAADLGPRDTCLEVGPGAGSLTGLLAARAAAVIAVEIDSHLAEIASENLGKHANVTILNTDALARKSVVAPSVVDAVRQSADQIGGSIKLVANLPYDIATSLIINLIVGSLPIERYCFTVQKEVADRFLAKPQTRDYGPVSIICDVFTKARRICQAPAAAFWPRPKVSSTMLALTARSIADVSIDSPADFAALVRSFFLHRRKTMGHIAATLPRSDRLKTAMNYIGIEPRRRPEDLKPPEWQNLYNRSR